MVGEIGSKGQRSYKRPMKLFIFLKISTKSLQFSIGKSNVFMGETPESHGM